MAKRKITYEHYFKKGQQVKVGIRLSAGSLRELNGEITAFAENRARVEILGGAGSKEISAMKSDGKISLSGWSGWGFYRCDGAVIEIVSPKEIDIRFEGNVDEIQRREYFRLDVSLPVVVTLPPEQTLASLTTQWEKKKTKRENAPPVRMSGGTKGYRAVISNNEEITSQEVNLSGGGVRLRTPAAIPIGSRVHVDIFLPLAPPRVISLVAEVLRCNEITLRIEKAPVFITAMKFILMEENDREAIISFLFSEQRNQLKSETDRDLPSPALR